MADSVVFVRDKKNRPLMPTNSKKAHALLKNGKARVVKRTPFTIKMLVDTGRLIQPLTLAVDTGSVKIGVAVVNERNGEIIYCSEVSIRNDISSKMKQRVSFRRTRRSRLRSRPARWRNRANSKRKNRFTPTMTSKIETHLKEINFVKSILPITKIILETAAFDIHALTNPAVKKYKWLYQKGPKFDFENTKAYVRHRDGYKCQICKGKSKDKMLHVHHIIFKSNNGSDLPSNLITLCCTCHSKLHSKKIPNKLSSSNIPKNTKHATQMNSIRVQLLKRLSDVKESFGYITKMNRVALELPKEHYFDAVAIASQGILISFKTKDLFIKRAQAKWEYKLTEGKHSQIKVNFGKKMGFLVRDKVIFKRKEHFVQSRRVDGCITLMDINCKYTTSTTTPAKLKRISARTSMMITRKELKVNRKNKISNVSLNSNKTTSNIKSKKND